MKQALAVGARLGRPRGLTVLTYHRVGGGTTDELDVTVDAFAGQLDALLDVGADVVALDAALDRLAAGDGRPTVVITFDDGFAEVHRNALPLLVERRLPFTLYLTAGLVGAAMRWEGSSGSSQGAPSLTWDAIDDLRASGLCTLGNHTWSHATPATVAADELERCSEEIERRTGEAPTHYAYTWGVVVPAIEPFVRSRFRSAVTGTVGRNDVGSDHHRLRRVPVRRTDPRSYFVAKVAGSLAAEHAYDGAVRVAKAIRRVR